MQFLTRALFVAVVLATGVVSEMHNGAICLTENDMGQKMFDKEATELACAEYQQRNTGLNKWDKCADCEFLDTPTTQYCESLDENIGGDEWLGYCQAFGATDSRAT